MKIVVTTDTYFPRVGGGQVHVVNVVEALKARGHEITIITNEPGESDYDRRYRTIRIPWSKRNILPLLVALWRESRDADVIQSHYCYRLAMLSGIVARIRRVPLFITLHGMGILDHPGTPFLFQLAHSIYRYTSLKLATHVISTSQDLADVAYRYISPKKISIVPNGYDALRFHPGIRGTGLKERFAGKKIIMTVRRLVAKNGVQYLIEAMPYLLKRNAAVHFVALGDGFLQVEIERRIKELGIEENVTLLGMVQNEDVPGYLAGADVVVFPSTAESSSIACAEAMGMRKKIVASRVGGLVELLGEHEERGWLVDLVPWRGSNYDAPKELPTDRYEALAERVADALRADEGKAESAFAWATSQLKWDRIAQRTETIYRDFL